MAHRIDNKGRRDDIYFDRKIDEILPTHIIEDYPNLTNFIENYYKFLDSDGLQSFEADIHDILSLRDLSESPTKYLDNLAYELGSQLENTGKFDDDRFSLKRLAYLYREKGTIKGVEEFFKLFFQTKVEVEFPKKDIFIVGEDEIGPDFENFIQDYKLYQNYSLLLKVGLSLSQYEFLYKKFMHPAGWYFQGQTSYTSQASLNLSAPLIIPDSGFAAYITEVVVPQYHMSRYTNLVQNSDGVIYQEMGGYHYLPHDSGNQLPILVEDYLTVPAWQLAKFYEVQEWGTPNSFTFDDSSHAPFEDSLNLDNTYIVRGANYEGEGRYRSSAAPSPYDKDAKGNVENTFFRIFDPGGANVGIVDWKTDSDIPGAPSNVSTNFDLDPSFWFAADRDWFINPRHLEYNFSSRFNTAQKRSDNIPGLYIRGSKVDTYMGSGIANTPYAYRIDSDAYFIKDSANRADGWVTPTQGEYFRVSRVQWTLKDSAGPDFSMDSLGTGVLGDSIRSETFDNDMFTRYDPWYHNRDSTL